MLKTIHYSALISLALMTVFLLGCKAEQEQAGRNFTIVQNYPDKNMTAIPIYKDLKKVLIWPTAISRGGTSRYRGLKGISPGALALNKMSSLTDAEIKTVTNRPQPIYEWPEVKDKSTLLLWVHLSRGAMRYFGDNISPKTRSEDRKKAPGLSSLALTIRHMRQGHESKYCTITLPDLGRNSDTMLKIIEAGISYCLEENATRKLVVPNQNSARNAMLDSMK